MNDENKLEMANRVYATLCSAIDARGWTYDKEDEDLVVHFGVKGDDIPMKMILAVDVDRQLIRLFSPLPFKISEGKRIEAAIATCAASYGMIAGSFDYDVSDGSITFRMTASFRESVIGEGLFQYLISCSCAMVDQYNDKFLALDKGMLSIEDFIKKA